MTTSKKLLTVGGGTSDYLTSEDVFNVYTYDGNTTYKPIPSGLKLGAGLTGGTASAFYGTGAYRNNDGPSTWGTKELTLSVWIRKDTRDTERFFQWGPANYIQLENDRISIAITNTAGTGIVNTMWDAPNGTFSDNQWHHILISVNTDSATSLCYVDGTARPLFAGSVTNGIIRDTDPMYIGGSATRPEPNDSTSLRGGLAHVFLDNSFRDISQQSVRDLFAGANNTPKNVATLNPMVYCPLGSSLGANLGTLGDFHQMEDDTDTEAGEIIVVDGPKSYEDGEGGLVITKSRTGTAYDTAWIDTERGVGQMLRGASSDKQGFDNNSITQFTPNGHALYNKANLNGAGSTFVSWSFRKAPGFLDIVTYTGDGSTQTIPHDLGFKPGFILIKGYDVNSQDWIGWHSQLSTFGAGSWIRFNSTESVQNTTSVNNVFGDNTQPVDPTDSGFTVGNYSHVNSAGVNYVAYIFANDDAAIFGPDQDQPLIKCGSYSGTAAEHDVDVGWEPQWLLVKDISRTLDNWIVVDTTRGCPRNGNDESLALNRPELANNHLFGDSFSVDANGFTVKGSDDAVNRSGDVYIYVAIRMPFRPAIDLPKGLLYTLDFGLQDSLYAGGDRYNANHRVDVGTNFTEFGTYNKGWGFRKHGQYEHRTSALYTPTQSAGYTWDADRGWANNSTAASSKFSHMWSRAPGYCDVVTFQGTGAANAVPHSLGVAPEFIILHSLTGSVGWPVWCAEDPSYYFFLNSAGDGQANNRFGTMTDTTFEVLGSNQDTNRSGDKFIATLFASVEGKSKVGSYFGNGNVDGPTVSCGFDPRFLMIRRAENSGSSWNVMSKRMGLYVGGSDWQSTFETTAANNLSGDFVDPTGDGFKLTTTDTQYNAGSSKYIYLAFA